MSVDGGLVYAIGDIHGCYDAMKALLADIARDCAERAAGRRPALIFLGDYVDRGPHSHKVLEALVWLQRRADVEVHLLKGNHEQALLAFLDAPQDGGGWLRFGGAETLAAYGVVPPGPYDAEDAYVRARDELMERMPASHLRLLERLELMVVVGDYAFVHAGVRPGTPLADQTETDLLWIRQGFLDAAGPLEELGPGVQPGVAVDHHLLERPQLLEHRIGLDTGAYATGVLTALRLEDGERAVLQAGGAPAQRPAPVPA